jgi:diguanylate cyclase (GGDEF)-like protein/PAS domain S-box-containing protein
MMDEPGKAKASDADLQQEIARLNKVVKALMDRAERNASLIGSDFNLFQTAITFEKQVLIRTRELEAALRENEKVTRALRESENRNRLLIENSPMCIHEIALDGRMISMNRSGLSMMGLVNEQEVLGYRYLDIVGEADRERVAALMAKAYAGESSHFEFEANGADGQVFKSCFVPLRDDGGRVEKLMGITEDITERKQAERQIRDLAFYDVLTRLANRRLLEDRLEQALSKSQRSGCFGALLFLDLDNFKSLNDAHGHEVGDLLLIEVAERISRCVRGMDTVARFGGDEFVVMLAELQQDRQVSQHEAFIVAEKIRVLLAEPYLLTNKQTAAAAHPVQHRCTASIGIELFRGQGASRKELLNRADSAMYLAKEEGRNRIRFFDEGG